MRAPQEARSNIGAMRDAQVWSPVLGRAVPVDPLVSEYKTTWENAVVRGRDRIPTIIASTNPRGPLADPLFARLRQPTIIWLTVPMAIIGITAGLLTTGGAFDFMSILGALSLVGLLIKNTIVLIDEMDQQTQENENQFEAVLGSAVSRMRPVVLAAATTILGLIPLLSDVFFVNMSVTMMAGLGFASILTLLVVPMLYCIFFTIHPTS